MKEDKKNIKSKIEEIKTDLEIKLIKIELQKLKFEEEKVKNKEKVLEAKKAIIVDQNGITKEKENKENSETVAAADDDENIKEPKNKKNNRKVLVLFLIVVFAIILSLLFKYIFDLKNELQEKEKQLIEKKEGDIDFKSDYFKEVADEVPDEELQDFNTYKDVPELVKYNSDENIINNENDISEAENIQIINTSNSAVVNNDEFLDNKINTGTDNNLANNNKIINNQEVNKTTSEERINEVKNKSDVVKQDQNNANLNLTKRTENKQVEENISSVNNNSEINNDNLSTEKIKKEVVKNEPFTLYNSKPLENNPNEIKISSDFIKVIGLQHVKGDKYIIPKKEKRIDSFKIRIKLNKHGKTSKSNNVEVMLVIKNNIGKTLKIDVKEIDFANHETIYLTFYETFKDKLLIGKDYNFSIFANKRIIKNITERL